MGKCPKRLEKAKADDPNNACFSFLSLRKTFYFFLSLSARSSVGNNIGVKFIILIRIILKKKKPFCGFSSFFFSLVFPSNFAEESGFLLFSRISRSIPVYGSILD